MKGPNTLLRAAIGSALLVFGLGSGCADSVGTPTSSDVGHVSMALSNGTGQDATVHVMVWDADGGALAFEQTFAMQAAEERDLDLTLDAGLHVADVELLSDDGLNLWGTGTAEFHLKASDDLDIHIVLSGEAAVTANEDGLDVSGSADAEATASSGDESVGVSGGGSGEASYDSETGSAEGGVEVGGEAGYEGSSGSAEGSADVSAEGSYDGEDGSAEADVDVDVEGSYEPPADESDEPMDEPTDDPADEPTDDPADEGDDASDDEGGLNLDISLGGGSDDSDDGADSDDDDDDGGITISIHLGLGG